jgi:sterol desaturase/sphingolipid hydroxylase (fatty acid hydroxylase superfamily)
VAQLIGVAPGQFIAIVAITQLSESLQHANLRLSFGAHRRAAVDQPALPPAAPQHRHRPRERGKGTLGGHNFGVLLPWWDMLFRTANFEDCATTPPASATRSRRTAATRDYGRGFWAQQWLGLKRMVGRG